MGKLIPDGIKIEEESEGHVHIAGEPGSGQETLCGWVDVYGERVDISEEPVDCPTCIQIVRYCRKLSFRPNRK